MASLYSEGPLVQRSMALNVFV